jgi:hypothetical protein
MSRTDHHRKPGTPPKARKQYIPRERLDLTRAVRTGQVVDLPTFEPVANRRTR